ncbi:MAG: hypothetical protein RQ745_06635 [Longimicrobiales bacterium]|nr:hypothetical protein [Longimicrobiales bacterium]
MLTLLPVVAACSAEPDPREAGDGISDGTMTDAAAPRESRTPGGVAVRLDPEGGMLGVGTNPVRIAFPEGLPATVSESGDDILSVDIVSIDMPTMGIRRFPIEHEAGSEDYISRIDVPMAGIWSVYVNIGDGTESAEFTFEVDGSHDHGAADPGTMDHGTMDHGAMETGPMETGNLETGPTHSQNTPVASAAPGLMEGGVHAHSP